MNVKCSKLIICELSVEVEVACCLGPDVCHRLPKSVNVFCAVARLSWDMSPLCGT